MVLVEANGPMERIATDILGELPETEGGNKYILVVSDYYTKWTFAMPNIEAKTVAKIIVEEVIVRFGVPHWIHSDQGRQFESLLFQEMCRILNIKKTCTTPYHPDLMNQRNWDEYIPFVMMAYRASEHETTGQTPNSLMLGRELSTPLDIMYEMPPSVKDIPAHKWAWELKEKLESSHSFVRGKIKGQMRRQKHYHNLKLSYQNFRKNDEVYVYFPVKKPGMSSKLTSFWKGPFKILEKYGDLTYKVDCGYRGKPQVIHVDRLKKKNKQTLRTESDNNTFVPLDTENDTAENNPIETSDFQDIAVNESSLPAEETEESSVEERRILVWQKTKTTPWMSEHWECVFCPSTFSKKDDRDKHLAMCAGARLFCKYDGCFYNTDKGKNLQRHVRNKHVDTKQEEYKSKELVDTSDSNESESKNGKDSTLVKLLKQFQEQSLKKVNQKGLTKMTLKKGSNETVDMTSSVQERREDSCADQIESLENNNIVKDIGIQQTTLCPSCSKRKLSVSCGVQTDPIFYTKTLKTETSYREGSKRIKITELKESV
ncbi:unnamed protein product [Mytilus coruscus]|uniref:Integrase catalytic domain-containing protein n=1 Tax=Mytilus coruscus TaxID=42192 RepID=A0A6J8BAL7_MYTCO|nr:unnamed protein product [Mytilus coruscus]